MRLWSDAFRDGEEIPIQYTKDRDNVSPSFRWADLPPNTSELALIFEGVTPATRKPWTHWLVYKIPRDLGGLPSGFKHMREPQEPAEILQGSNSLGNIGYDGPQGTLGRVFRYRIRLLAVGAPLDARPGLVREEFEQAVDGHLLDQAEVHARYERRA
jgi:Raf kinase inhibitor-like YbhB/YbcL family protein